MHVNIYGLITTGGLQRERASTNVVIALICDCVSFWTTCVPDDINGTISGIRA